MPPPPTSNKPKVGAKANGSSPAPTKDAVNGTTSTKSAPKADAADGERAGKPDQAKFQTEQDEHTKEIAAVRQKLVSG